MEFYTQEVVRYFKIRQITSEEIQVMCPYHEDKRPSASINITKKLFNCFAGCGGKSFEQLYREVINGTNVLLTNRNSILSSLDNITYNHRASLPEVKIEEQEIRTSSSNDFKIQLGELLTQAGGQSFRVLKSIEDDEVIHYLQQLISSKGIKPDTLDKIGAYPVVNKEDQFYGYIKFPNDSGGYVYRKFLPDEILEGERYINSKGEKPYYGTISDKYKDYILVEGIFDYLSLLEEGYNNVICNLGTAINDKRAFKFKGKVVFILFDNDFAGYQGAEKAYGVLRKIKAYPIGLDLPEQFGKDVNEAITTDKERFIKWLNSYITKFDNDDTGYIQSFGNEEKLYTLKTPLDSFNKVLGGGFKVGLHAIAAEPTVGKSALALFLSDHMCKLNEGAKGLYLTYEIPKKQCWARIASQYDSRPWNMIEADSIMEPAAKEQMINISKRLRIEAYWDISEIMRVADEYNFFVIDYIQKMPGDSDERINTVRNTKALSRLALQRDKIVIIVSTISRGQYGKEELGIFKESGDIEYSIQSGFLISKINDGGLQRMLKITTLKNTRGPVGGNFWIEGNMLHNSFKDTVALKLEGGDF